MGHWGPFFFFCPKLKKQVLQLYFFMLIVNFLLLYQRDEAQLFLYLIEKETKLAALSLPAITRQQILQLPYDNRRGSHHQCSNEYHTERGQGL